MHIVILILSIVASINVLLLIIAIFTRKRYNTQREIIIHLPLQKVFDYLKQIKNQDNFNMCVKFDLYMKRQFKGTDGTVGFV